MPFENRPCLQQKISSLDFTKNVFQGHIGTTGPRGAVGPQGAPVSQESAVRQKLQQILLELSHLHPFAVIN